MRIWKLFRFAVKAVKSKTNLKSAQIQVTLVWDLNVSLAETDVKSLEWWKSNVHLNDEKSSPNVKCWAKSKLITKNWTKMCCWESVILICIDDWPRTSTLQNVMMINLANDTVAFIELKKWWLYAAPNKRALVSTLHSFWWHWMLTEVTRQQKLCNDATT